MRPEITPRTVGGPILHLTEAKLHRRAQLEAAGGRRSHRRRCKIVACHSGPALFSRELAHGGSSQPGSQRVGHCELVLYFSSTRTQVVELLMYRPAAAHKSMPTAARRQIDACTRFVVAQHSRPSGSSVWGVTDGGWRVTEGDWWENDGGWSGCFGRSRPGWSALSWGPGGACVWLGRRGGGWGLEWRGSKVATYPPPSQGPHVGRRGGLKVLAKWR